MRLVYCPSEDMLAEAEQLAKNCGVPIVIGDNAFTSNLDFDRSVVQVVSAPGNDSLGYLPNAIVAMCHEIKFQSAKITDLAEAICIYTLYSDSDSATAGDELTFAPYMHERSYVRFLNRIPSTGVWGFRINLHGSDLAFGEVTVHEDGRYRETSARYIPIQKSV